MPKKTVYVNVKFAVTFPVFEGKTALIKKVNALNEAEALEALKFEVGNVPTCDLNIGDEAAYYLERKSKNKVMLDKKFESLYDKLVTGTGNIKVVRKPKKK